MVLEQTLTLKVGVTLVLTVTQVYVFVNLQATGMPLQGDRQLPLTHVNSKEEIGGIVISLLHESFCQQEYITHNGIVSVTESGCQSGVQL